MAQEFVVNIVIKGMTQTDAARAAGYASPGVAAHLLMKKSTIAEAIRAARMAAVDGEHAGTAFATLAEIMKDDTNPASARVAAAKTVLTIGGYLERGKAMGKKGEKEVKAIGEMTPAELRAEIDGMRDQLDKAEELVDSIAADNAQVIDIINESESVGSA